MTHVRAEMVVERPGDYWRQEQVAQAYDRGRFDSLWGRIYRWREERTIVQALHGVPRSGTVLDAACGTGRITALLQQQGFRASGMRCVSGDDGGRTPTPDITRVRRRVAR